MPGRNYYLITSLPPLGELGSVPPLGPADLRAHLAGASSALRLTDAVLLSDDLLQRQSFLAGEIEQVSPVVLTAEQTRDEAPLPETIVPTERETPEPVGVDEVWEGYYRHVAQTGRADRNRFLSCWVRYEVALRNALAAERAQALDLDLDQYLVAVELGNADMSFEQLIAEWASAPDPLSALRVLDRGRWGWLDENDSWFSFSDDELLVYAVKVMLLHRWNRLTEDNDN